MIKLNYKALKNTITRVFSIRNIIYNYKLKKQCQIGLITINTAFLKGRRLCCDEFNNYTVR
ncbi:hypothetical protein HLPCO_002265 [Haloplasma contractile SSD-17B]|uniref:Uncharacterized protein n=1 Tax=Haloplasma contractile SSD-17B TaxID=1033810 RepID=U2DTH4_9MOLU|nr:hypothetical protein HLPCO_002265 [Haloplasma contractile SSD-17B]